MFFLAPITAKLLPLALSFFGRIPPSVPILGRVQPENVPRIVNGAVAFLAVIVIGVPLAYAGITLHDNRIRAETLRSAHAEQALKTERAKAQALEQALADRDQTLRLRELSLKRTEDEIAALDKRLTEARNATAQGPDPVVFAADDPWLQGRRPARRPDGRK